MTDGTLPARGGGAPKVAFFNDPKTRSLIFQGLALALLVFVIYSAVSNALTNLSNQRIAAGFGFLDQTAGFGISQTPIAWAESMSYGRAFVIGLLNTLLVAVVGIFFATILGFVVGVARLSPNWVISKIAYWYVEIIRNLPLLFRSCSGTSRSSPPCRHRAIPTRSSGCSSPTSAASPCHGRSSRRGRAPSASR